MFEEAAQQLEVASAEFDRLGRVLSKLNFFRAAGITWSELRHSDFLAFLLSPTENHRLGDKFLKRFLHHVLVEHAASVPLSPEELSALSLNDTEVHREKDYIDILLVNVRVGLAVIIENKTGSQEHGDQLQRYWDSVVRQSRRTAKVLGLFLSPTRVGPSDARYLPISYRTVHRALEDVRQMPEVSQDPDLKVILRHYSQLVEGEFMEQPRAATIAWEIHRKYPRVIGFLNTNSPAQQIKNEIKVLISETEKCSFEKEKADELSFVLSQWRKEPLLVTGPIEYSAAWLFWFDGFDERLRLWLGSDPGNKEAVDKLEVLARAASPHFPAAGKIVGGWPTIWSREFLSSSDLKELDRDRIFTKIRERWQNFRDRSLPALMSLLSLGPKAPIG